MKRILTEDNPTLLYADETAYVDRLHHDQQSLEDALTLFDVGRRQWSRVLRLLPDDAFSRQGTHNRAGIVTVGNMSRDTIKHSTITSLSSRPSANDSGNHFAE